jgi:hypothetical protein
VVGELCSPNLDKSHPKGGPGDPNQKEPMEPKQKGPLLKSLIKGKGDGCGEEERAKLSPPPLTPIKSAGAFLKGS